MSARELRILGTASQVPTAYRNHNGFFLRWDDEGILFDPGEGTQRQLTIAGISASQITRICITHFHGDHCLGLPGVIQRLSLDDVPHPVTVHYPRSGQVYFDRLWKASIYAAREKLDPQPFDSSGGTADWGGLHVEAHPLEHGVDCLGYRIQEPDSFRFDKEALARLELQGPIVGRLRSEGAVEHQGRTIQLAEVTAPHPGQAFAFVMDTKMCTGAERLLRNADLAVCESTYCDDEEALAETAGHLTARQAASLAVDASVRRLTLAHFSQRYRELRSFAEQAQQHEDVVIARDPSLDQPGHPRANIAVPSRQT